MRVMISGGGTGGHVSPALAIIEELRRRDPQLLLQWVGRRGGMEERAARRHEVPFRSVPVAGWPRERGPRQLWVAARLGFSGLRALTYLQAFRPQVVVGVGGYVALPLLYMAQRFGVRTMIHEQNKRLGMANRLLAARATRIFLSFEDTQGNYPRDRARVVGNPVRSGFIAPPDRASARAAMELDPHTPVVLVVGGSQGARSINAAMEHVVREFGPGEAQFVWMTGRNAAPKVSASAQVRILPFIDDMPAACAAADLIVTRAGASSTAEIAAMGKPSILVPYPHATDNHQQANATAFEDVGAGVMLLDHECTGEALAARIRELLADPGRLDAMGQAAKELAKPLAAEQIAEEIMLAVFGETEEPRTPA